MIRKAEMGSRLAIPSQMSLLGAADELASTVPPAPAARPVVVITRGRVEYTTRCPGCGQQHRHLSLGEKTGPCGTTYDLRPRRGRPA